MYERNKSLVWSIAALIVLNIGSLGFLWYKQTEKPPRPTVSLEPTVDQEKFLEKELRLTKEQTEAFRQLRRKHQEDTWEIRRDIHRFSKDIVDELYKAQPDTARVRALSEEIGRKQAEFERANYEHFKNLKQVCDSGQQERLHGLLFEILDRVKLDRPPGPPKNNPGEQPRSREEKTDTTIVPRQKDDPGQQSQPRTEDKAENKRPPRRDDNLDRQPPPRPEDNADRKEPPRGDDDSDRRPPPRRDDDTGKQPPPRPEDNPDRK